MLFKLPCPKFFIIVTVLFSMFYTCLQASPAFANQEKDIFERFLTPMPEFKRIDQQTFIKNTKPIQDTPYGEKVLAYSMRVPKNWTKGDDRSSSNFMLSEKLFLELVSYYGKPKIIGRSRVEVQALKLEENLTAVQWYFKFLLEGGYTTEGLVAHNDNKIESLRVVTEDNYSYYMRTLVTINGERIIMVRYYTPVQVMKKYGAMQEQVIASFNITHPIKRKEIQTQSYKFLDVAETSFPESWEVIAKPLRSADRMEASLVNIKQFQSITHARSKRMETLTEGTVDLLLVSSSSNNSLLDEVEKYKKFFETKGILLHDKMENAKNYTYNDNIDFGLTEVYRGADSTNNLTEFEIWFTVMVGGNYYYFITLLTPSRNEQFTTWAENTRSYELIINKFTPMSGAFLSRD